jgi:hypothetical protein
MALPVDEMMNDLYINILKDIDSSLETKIMDYRLDLETYTNEKSILKYIENEKSKLRKLLKEVPIQNIRATDKYRRYLNQKPLNSLLREKAINDFINIQRESLELYNSEKIWFVINSYEKEREVAYVKSTIEIATLLEYNSFLTDEINRIKQEISNQLDSKNNKLNWKGSKAELIELLKALIENGNIEGTQKNIISSFTNFLNVELKEPKSTIQRLDKRKDKTIFLDKLKSSLIEFYLKKDE